MHTRPGLDSYLCTILGISISWLHKWIHREPADRQRRRAALDSPTHLHHIGSH